ncbi:hypothetical protein MKJ04_21275 [Pontibacter sp. E15-1]|uniref:hypothetical protein n=1 Tax=Pontibacter sp. E15-1 TaxID=2919918 RepID=UPI001F4F8CC6|nr:hypothetical protein [Pontibacter sp. E15-1]MCJ8167387.1 hypothetical protein [Pontibacter sp. E15-1]
MMVVLETPYVKISYLFQVNCLSVSWLMRPTDAVFIEAHVAIVEFLSKNFPVKLYCTDLTLVGALTKDQETWLATECYNKTYNILNDDFYVAVVFSENHFKAVVSNYMVPSSETADDYVHFNYFTDQEEALHWLENIKKGQDSALFPFAT